MKRIIILTVSLLALVSIVFWTLSNGRSGGSDSITEAVPHVEPGRDPLAPKQVAPDSRPSETSHTPYAIGAGTVRSDAAQNGGKLASYLCDVETENCPTSPSVARSLEEAQWLARHGYPTLDQEHDYASMSAEELREGAMAGDLALAALYGRRLIEEGNTHDGQVVLHRAVKQGGVYAFYEIAKFFKMPGPQANYYEAASNLRLAYLLGDHYAARAMVSEFAEFLSPGEMLTIDQRAAHLRNQMFGTQVVVPRP